MQMEKTVAAIIHESMCEKDSSFEFLVGQSVFPESSSKVAGLSTQRMRLLRESQEAFQNLSLRFPFLSTALACQWPSLAIICHICEDSS